jgi:hypothetical protein
MSSVACLSARKLFLLYLCTLKVPKCEIFDRLDFPDFYTIKSRPEGDFGVKIKNLYIYIFIDSP